jgi:hypothetical protein
MTVDHFYGIEINPFAVELAKLSIWLAEHQMNVEFQDKFSVTVPSIPLKDSAKIVAANACRINWEEVCPKGAEEEIFILGNPPYLGSKVQAKEHKEDILTVFSGHKNYKDLDYISCWFYKGANFCKGQPNISYSFVTTNSVCQGNQVAMLWPIIFEQGLEISYAYKSFKWANNAKDKAAVICIIISIRNISSKPKFLFLKNERILVKHINGYLLDAQNIFIGRRSSPISQIPFMGNGNMANNGDAFMFTPTEKQELLQKYPESEPLFQKIMGSKECCQGIERWCLWIDDEKLGLALNIEPIKNRIEQVKEKRLASSDSSSRKLAQRPHQFRDRRRPKKTQIIIPSATSERREYIPMDFLNHDIIVSNLAHVIFDPEPYIFSILISKIHMVWMKVVSGRLKTDFRYSSAITYNNFPIPKLKYNQMESLSELCLEIIDARNMHPGKTLAQLYDPDKMPQNLRDAHHELDLAVDAIYRKEPFKNDEERLAHLFKLYEKMTSGEKK